MKQHVASFLPSKLLKAKNEPIIATSQGYLYISMNAGGGNNAERIVAFAFLANSPPVNGEPASFSQ
jgi:hypothetical protein